MKKIFTLVLFVLISTIAFSQWPSGTTINVPVSTATGDQYMGFWTKSAIASDGNGGAIVTWYNNSTPYEIYAARINKNGVVQWSVTVCSSLGSNGRGNSTIISDNAGGAIVVWEDGRDPSARDIYGARLNASGSFVWGSGNGLAIATGGSDGNKYYPVLCSDGANGAIVSWTANISDGGDIYAKHVDASGTLSWGATGGLKVCNATNAQTWPAIASDGKGGAIISWEDWRNGSTNKDIYAKRINAGSATAWGGALGSIVCDTSGNQLLPVIIADGSSGAIIAWSDARLGGQRIYCQKVDSTGNMLWATNGNLIFTASSENVRMASNGAGGAYITWNTGANLASSNAGPQNIVAQLIDAAGTIKWAANGQAICTLSGTQWRPDIVSTVDGGAIIAWGDYRGPTIYSDLYAQKVDTLGPVWTPSGVAVSTPTCSQGAGHVALVNDGCGGAILAWMDRRNDGSCVVNDIYAQNINSDSTLGGISGTLGCAIVPPPIASFQSSDSSFCANDCISFTDLSSNAPTSWLWTFPGGTPATSTSQNPFVCYTNGGIYNVTLIVSNNGGSDTLTAGSLLVVTDAPPTPTISVVYDTLKCSYDPSYQTYQWYQNSTQIPGATESYYIATSSGNYNVSVTNEFGCSTAVGIVLGLKQSLATNNLRFTPNPVINELNVKGYLLSKKNKLMIFNLIGEEVYSEELNTYDRLINCKNLTPGIYFLQVTNELGSWIGKFVKE